jgi:hypothetical protein
MRLREACNICQHGCGKVRTLDPQMVEHLGDTVGHRKICSDCHSLTACM